MNKKKTQKKETGETDSLTDYDVSVNESKSLGSCFWTIFSRVMIVVVSTRFVLIYTSAGPPIQNPCCPWVIVFECLGSERAPSPFDESVWQGGARRNAPKGGKIKCLHSDASA
jgi:hypothetical protein